MPKIKLDYPDSVPLDQIDIPFLQGMIARMAQGYFKYGHMRRQNNRPDNIKCLQMRLDEYCKTHNTEFLMDAANYAMMEFCFPVFSDAYFRVTSENESPGAIVDNRHIKDSSQYISNKYNPSQRKEGD